MLRYCYYFSWLLFWGLMASAAEPTIDIYDSPSYKDKSVIVVTLENGQECKLLVDNIKLKEYDKIEGWLERCYNVKY